MNADTFRLLSWYALRSLATMVLLLVATAATQLRAQPQLQSRPGPTSGNTAASLIIDAGVHLAPVRRIAVDAAGQMAVTASDDKTAIVWNLADMKPARVLRVPVATGEVGRLYGVAKEPGGPLVAVAGTTGTKVQPRQPQDLCLRQPHRCLRARFRRARRRHQTLGLVRRRPLHGSGLRR